METLGHVSDRGSVFGMSPMTVGECHRHADSHKSSVCLYIGTL